MKSQDLKKNQLPNSPGIYRFIGAKREVLYIGKATSLHDRVRSYFGKDLIVTRGPLLVDMVTKAKTVDFIKTDSVLEALVLEAELIKKYQPKYNTKEKDNKSFNFVCITKDSLSKVLVVRGRNLDKSKYKKIFGPFTNSNQLREAMKIIRRIFPFFDEQSIKKQNTEFYRQLGLVPNINIKQKRKNVALRNSHSGLKKQVLSVGSADPYEQHFSSFASFSTYEKNIKNLILFFQGKKKKIIQNLKKEMTIFAKKKEFEKAGEIKKRIFALNHINDVALIKEYLSPGIDLGEMRIEAYDVAHMSGQNMVGVMTVIVDGEIEKNEYKKFIIKTVSDANDSASLYEILSRRFKHDEWTSPALIVVDGNNIQKNVAEKVLKEYKLKIPVVGVVKDERHKPKAIIGDENIIKKYKKYILLANSEAHRFAITYYRQKSQKNMLK